MHLSAVQVAAATRGEIVAGDRGAVATTFSFDSRTLEPGACFVALRGQRDGHDFVDDAARAGATVALVEHRVDGGSGRDGIATVRVPDTDAALVELARFARARLGSGAVVVGITGSAGKTTTKDLLAAVLQDRFRVVASAASYNNEVGVPLTLLGTDPGTDVVVAEMGARFAGNIRMLCEIARPHVGVITNIGEAHAGLLGGQVGVAQAKGELFEALPSYGLAVVDAGAEYVDALVARTSAHVVRVGPGGRADYVVTDVGLDAELRPSFSLRGGDTELRIKLGLRGEHQVMNAALAAAVALELGVPTDMVVPGLSTADAAPGRMALGWAPNGVRVLDDAYNASPTSTRAALKALQCLAITGRRVAVLGEMRELGDQAGEAHAEIGRLAVECGVTKLVVVGDAARPVGDGARDAGGLDVEVTTVDDVDGAISLLLAGALEPGDAVLVKASRAVGLDRVVAALVSPGASA